VSLSRRELLRRATALAATLAFTRLRWVERAAASASDVRQTLDALVRFVVPDKQIRAATTPRLIRTLDRFLPGPQPLSATAAAILDGGAAQVKPGATFAQLTAAEKQRAFDTLERAGGSIQFLAGNLMNLTAFLAYSTRAGWRFSRYAGASRGHKEFKGYWRA
jgi:hypothetical protein